MKNNVLTHAHRDPLIEIKKLKKIECFSKKGFEELKEICRRFCNDREARQYPRFKGWEKER